MGKLLVLYLTLEQETAIHQLFSRRDWTVINLGTFLSEKLENEMLCAWEQSKKKTTVAADTKTKKESFEKPVIPNIDGTAADESRLLQAETKALVITGTHKTESDDVIHSGDTVKASTEPCKRGSDDVAHSGDTAEAITEPCRIETDDVIFSINTAEVRMKRKPLDNQIITEKKSRKPRRKRNTIQIKTLNLRSRNLNIESEFRENAKVDRNQKMSNIDINNVHVKQTKSLQPMVSYQNKEKHTDQIKGSNDEGNKQYSPETLTEKLDESIEHKDVTDRSKNKFGKTDNNQEIELLAKDAKKGWKCDKCSYRTNVRSNLNRHAREIHSGIRHRCSKCNKTFKGKHDAKMHELYGHNSGLQCKECDKTFSSMSGLRNHVKIIHKNSTLYKCEHCDMKFYYKSHYLGHVNKHLDVKPYSCKTCQKPFRYKVACHLHEKTCCSENYYITHNPDGSLKEAVKCKFLCDICGLELTSKSSLKMHHYYTHSDDTTTVCSLCGKSFKGTYSLQRHMRNAHEDTGVRYTCPECKKEFSQQQIFKQHLKIHKKAYTCFCETCGKGFLSKFKMMEHARTHTGEKPFSCPHCLTYKSATKTNLQKHMRIHDESRLPRQQPKKKRKRESVVPKEKSVLVDKLYDQAKTVEGCTKNADSYIEPIYVSLQMSTGSYVRTLENNLGQSKYTNLDSVSVDNDSIRYGTQFYDHSYMEEQSISQQQDQDNFTMRTQQIGEDQIPNSFEIRNMQRPELENKQRSETNMHSKDIVKSGCQNNYEINSHCDGYYGNDSSSEPTELSQGLNILTVAMNIVNPSQY
ncbi:zinc finger protein 37-like [Mercenaria mercenaria]|uniref:zinc finger protein 37-like n=1 Tax=Mercenaria mercenaria TaxID=6596 RepID=UPI00234ECD0C|nr:zinc finger protein 37-like [Mercenaria mercenaria]